MVGHIQNKHFDLINLTPLKEGAKKRKVCIDSLIMIEKRKIDANCCFGCKKFWCKNKLAEKHFLTCSNLDLHSNICFEILNKVETAKNVSDVPTETTEAPTNERILKLEAENENLKAVLKKLYANLASMEESNEKEMEELNEQYMPHEVLKRTVASVSRNWGNNELNELITELNSKMEYDWEGFLD
jgi:hypothetical protein